MIRLLTLIVGALLLLAGCGVTAPAPHTLPGAAATVSSAPTASRPVQVSIPALGVTDEIVPVGLNPDRSMVIPPVDKVGWYQLGPLPGERGPAILAGHVNFNGVNGSFVRIGELKPGDSILITAVSGAQIKFTVYRVIHYPKSAPDLHEAFGDTPGPELHLITCSGTVRDHEYSDNTVALARVATS